MCSRWRMARCIRYCCPNVLEQIRDSCKLWDRSADRRKLGNSLNASGIEFSVFHRVCAIFVAFVVPSAIGLTKVAAAARCARSEAQKHTGSRSVRLTGFAWSHSADFEVCNSLCNRSMVQVCQPCYGCVLIARLADLFIYLFWLSCGAFWFRRLHLW